MKFINFPAGRLLLFSVLLTVIFPVTFSRAATDAAEADFTPWSGYWWPTNGGGLATGNGYNGHPAPLEKYDLLTGGAYPGPATQWYLDHNYDPTAPGWYGFCGAWASASVTENITFYPSIVDGVLLNVGDKKGLLTAAHEYDTAVRMNAFQPEVFHSWLLQYIKEAGISFYAELDPGNEIWNYPVYRYEMDVIDYGDKLSVSCQIWYADDQVDPDYQGTKSLTKIYTYYLTKGADGEITGGEWTDYSIYDHPQQLILPVSPYSNNPYLDYEFIRNLALSRDDELESDQPAVISPGTYMLLLLNKDEYTISCDAGDTIILYANMEDQVGDDVNFEIHDGEDQVVYSGNLGVERKIVIAAAAPPYLVTFSTDDYSSNYVYNLTFDLKKSFEFVNAKIQKGFSWGGLAITNSSDSYCDNIYVVGYDEDGLPIETYSGPFSLGPGRKKTVEIADFDVKTVDQDKFIGVKIHSSNRLEVVNLFGYFSKNMSCYGSVPRRKELVIPDLSGKWDYSRSVRWGLFNPGIEDYFVNARLFSSSGEEVESTDLTLSANAAEWFDGNNSPFAGQADRGWVLVSEEDQNSIQGFVEWLENGITKAEALEGLGVGKSFFVPQVIDTSDWQEKITIINVSSVKNTVTLTLVDNDVLDISRIELQPREKKVMDITAVFPDSSSDVLNLAALEITAEQDMAGYVNLITSGDDLYYPLLNNDDLAGELIVPHVAVNDYWWTGFTFFNPFQENSVLTIIPYDADGEVMADLVVDEVIEANSKGVFSGSGLFGAQASSISFIKAEVISGPEVVGVYGYGNSDCTMLSGSVMR